MTLFVTERLVIRNWQDDDRDLFPRINSDDRVMAYFPFRRSRAECDRLLDELRNGIAKRGFGFCAASLRHTGECIGFVGLHQTEGIPALPAGTVEIGWRLAPEFWGHGYVTEAATAWLRFGFERLGLEEIVSFAVRENQRSLAVMRRIGMTSAPGRDFDHPAVPDSHPHLKRHVVYRLTRREWQSRAR